MLVVADLLNHMHRSADGSEGNLPAGAITVEIDAPMPGHPANANDIASRGEIFDAWGRLVGSSYVAASGFCRTVVYTLDALGRVTAQGSLISQGGSGNWTQFFSYDLAGNVIQETNNGSVRENVYSPADGRLVMTEAISATTSGGTTTTTRTDYYPVTDAQGSVVAVVAFYPGTETGTCAPAKAGEVL